MDGFLHTLLTMSLTAAIAAGVVMLLRLLLKRVPRWITCLLWAVVLLRMVCPGGVSLPVSLMPETVSSGAYIERVLPQQTPAAEAQATVPTPRDHNANTHEQRDNYCHPRRPATHRAGPRHGFDHPLGRRWHRLPGLGRCLLPALAPENCRRHSHREKHL